MTLCTRRRGRLVTGRIVEVEAYDGSCDEAAHSFRGRTERNEVMFWDGGHCYVYFIYGMHHCVNVVTGPRDHGAAVLIRAVEPLHGHEIMESRRERSGFQLTNGPGKVCAAMGIGLPLSGEDLLGSKRIWIENGTRVPRRDIERSKRIGITKARELQWRFSVRGNPWVSRIRPST